LTDKRKLRTAKRNSPLLEIARVLVRKFPVRRRVRLDHVASLIVNANHSGV
jgi:hypothetical protein